ncbi:MAG TPA: hypothetical protein VG294_11375 [Solirubrobacteraceae bacterium]|nr:hypothetical protein [Solirubrobacteraceae bacterium]
MVRAGWRGGGDLSRPSHATATRRTPRTTALHIAARVLGIDPTRHAIADEVAGLMRS